MNFIKVVFIDGHSLFLQGMYALLEQTKFPTIKIVGEYQKIDDFFREFSGDADVVVTELSHDDNDNITFITKIKAMYQNPKIVVLSAYKEYRFVKEAIRNGADGYLLKSSDINDFENCLLDVLENKTYLGKGVYLTPPASLFKNGLAKVEVKRRYEDRFMIKQKLTRRETEILRLITQARTNNEIGEMLYISDQTVGAHKKSIMRKLGTKSTVALIKYALENEIV